MVWTMLGPAAAQASEEYSYLDLLRSCDPPCFAKYLNEEPQIIALPIILFDRHITMIISPWSIRALIRHEIASSLNSILSTCLPKWFR